MPTILAVDTSTDACSVALYAGKNTWSDHRVIPRKHADTVLEMIEGLLERSGITVIDLDAIAAGIGPGSFTGIRIATAVCQGLAYAHDLPVIPVSGLRAMAWQAWQDTGCELVFTCLDARIGEMYWGVFTVDANGVVSSGQDRLSPPALVNPEIPAGTTGVSAVGNGLVYFDELSEQVRALLRIDNVKAVPDATALLALAKTAWDKGQVFKAEQLVPAYLRDNVARKPE